MDMRPRSIRRFAVGFISIVALAIVGSFAIISWLAGAFGATGGSERQGGPFPGVLFVLLFVIVGGSIVRRAIRGVAMPVGDLIEAAGRVESGEYGARVPERGPRELRSVARAFNTMAMGLETNEQRRRQLLADVTHELRNPLTVMQGNIEALVDGVYPIDRAHLEVLLDESKVLARLIDDLRTLSLAEAGRLTLDREPIDVATIATDVLTAFADRARRAGVVLRPMADGPAVTVDGDPVRIREVLANLIGNSLRYTPSAGTITIEVRDGTMVEIGVRDTGTGIAPEQLAHVFERYSRSTGSPGAGLGLAIAKGLVEAHGGTIHAESAPGQGTLISFTLPRPAIAQPGV